MKFVNEAQKRARPSCQTEHTGYLEQKSVLTLDLGHRAKLGIFPKICGLLDYD